MEAGLTMRLSRPVVSQQFQPSTAILAASDDFESALMDPMLA
jgi:hypothetical protein